MTPPHLAEYRKWHEWLWARVEEVLRQNNAKPLNSKAANEAARRV